MKILYVHAKGEVGGSDISLLTILKNISRELFTPNLIVAKKGPLFKDYQKYCKNCKEVNLSVLKTPDNIFEFFKMIVLFLPSIFIVWNVIRKWKIDIVHVNSIVMPSAIIAGNLAGKPVIVHKREIITSNKLVSNILDFISYVFADKVIAVSNAVKNSSLKLLQKKTVVVYNGVDVSDIENRRSNKFRELYKIPKDTLLVGIFSRIEPWKGQDIVIKAMPKVLSEIRDVKIVIFGSPYTKRGQNYLEELKSIVKNSNLENIVLFPGIVKTVNDIYSDFDLVILPSRDPEPLGRVLIEAMIAERAVISTDIGGAKEVIENGRTGIFVRPKNVEDMSNEMIKVLKSKSLRDTLGVRARKEAIRKFNMESIIKNVEMIYTKIKK